MNRRWWTGRGNWPSCGSNPAPAGLPLDVCSQAGLLRLGDRLAGQEGGQRRPQVRPVTGTLLPGAVIKLPPIDEPALASNRRNPACRRPGRRGPRPGIRRRDRETCSRPRGSAAMRAGLSSGMGGHVVRADGHQGRPLAGAVLPEPGQPLPQRGHVRAVVADEGHHEGWRGREVSPRQPPALWRARAIGKSGATVPSGTWSKESMP